MLTVQSLKKSFGAHRAVDGVSFDVQPGEMLALIGPNGAGKTTTFNMINGQLAADAGQVLLDGHDMLGLDPRQIARLGVARTFQVAATFASFTVMENVQTALLAHHQRLFRFFGPARHQYTDEALALLEQVGMVDQAQRPCSELAYGDVKRVELAMALASQPRLLLMDEPVAGMAPGERRALMEQVAALAHQRNMAVLFTEHSMDVVFAHADRIVVLARGALIASGRPEVIRDDPAVQRVYFGSSAGQSEETPQLGTQPAQSPEHSLADVPRSVLLDVQQLNAWYGAAHVLDDVTLSVRQGEVVALLGRNGAGKSTTLKAMMGLLARADGRVSFMDTAIMGMTPHRIARLGLGYVPEDRRIFTDLTVAENLRCGQQPARHWPDGTAAPVWNTAMLFEYFPNLAQMASRTGEQMSGGEQQMLSVARTLMGNPLVVLLDEPSEGVAPVIVEAMARMIDVMRERGVAVVLAEQNMGFAARVADRAYVLEKGLIRYDGSMASLMRDEATRRAYLAV